MNAEEYYNLGRNKYDLMQHEEAIKIYSEAIELYPNYNIFYFERGFNYTYIGEYCKAIADYEKYMVPEKNVSNADYNHISGSVAGIAYIKYKQGLYDEALQLYKLAGEYNISDEVRRAIIYATGVCENEKMKYKLLSKLDNLTDEIQGHLKKFGKMVDKYETEMSDFNSQDNADLNCEEIGNRVLRLAPDYSIDYSLKTSAEILVNQM